MKMVAAAKLRRAQDAIENARPYATRMRATLEEVSRGVLEESHPLLEVHEQRKTLEIVVVTSDRGLAGAFNSNVSKLAERVLKKLGNDWDHGLGIEGMEHATSAYICESDVEKINFLIKQFPDCYRHPLSSRSVGCDHHDHHDHPLSSPSIITIS